MTVEEHQRIKGNAQLSQLAASLNQDSVMKLFRQEGEALENVRLYTGEYLWSLCFCYEAIVLRALLSLMFSHDDSSKLEWYKDAGTLGLISAVLSPEEFQEFNGTAFGKLGWIQRRLEWKILSASQKVISGEQCGVEVLERTKVIQERAAELNRS
ncbi:MAG: hypothetical protein LLG20_24805 [Acidobacteriales bacterium]|nr:hypothetical protein [Terriglobales bacterium]